MLPPEEDLVHIYYAALNFRDLMTASGRLAPEVITEDRIQQECIQGFEFAGRDSNGERVFGMCSLGSAAL
ncbi:hypothetical protein QE152_g5976 [Popillia japonica]|uniref:Uncharacterized protein n=1 Tax=Popillia japonica TaxID=7064 RepID=A0AAW1MKC0_POPJA